MRRRRKPRPAPSIPFRPCSLCYQGLLLVDVMRGGRREREGRRCQCLKQWLVEQKTPSGILAPERSRADLA